MTPQTTTIDATVQDGLHGRSYDWANYDDLTYCAWLLGRQIAGKPTIKEITAKQDGAASTVSLHPANWR